MGKGASATSKKVRFDGLDVAAMVCELEKSLLGRRIINIYDGLSDHDAFLIKFDGSGVQKTAAKKEKTEAQEQPNTDKKEQPCEEKEENKQQQEEKKEDDDEVDEKQRAILFMESGVRFHTTSHFTSLSQSSAGGSGNSNMPSPFCFKLRKHLRGLRLERIVQLGNYDRVVHFIFGTGNQRHSLILELYARGNLILTDSSYNILALLRSHEYEDEQIKVGVGQVYPITYATTTIKSVDVTTPSSDADKVDDNNNNSNKDQKQLGLLHMTGAQTKDWARQQLQLIQQQRNSKDQDENQKQSKKKDSGAPVIPLKALLLKQTSGCYHYGPSLLEHCILAANLSPNIKIGKPISDTDAGENDGTLSVEQWEQLIQSLKLHGSAILHNLSNNTNDFGGYVVYRQHKNEEQKSQGENTNVESKEQGKSSLRHSDKLLEEFQPHLLEQHKDRPHLKYNSFSQAVDDFFFHIGAQRQVLKAQAAERAARDRLEKIQRDQERRVVQLQRDQEQLYQHAQLVQVHASEVDKALAVINSALGTGMDWEALQKLVEIEQVQNQNPIALLIKRLDLEHNAMVLALPENNGIDNDAGKEDDDADEKTNDKRRKPRKINVTISLSESAYGNARDLFAKYRAFKEKSQKTLEASTKALKSAQANAQRQLQEAQTKGKIVTSSNIQRKFHWFEKFHWFVTSDNYLVLAGRDAHQNELLVKRYLRKGDAYLHADVHGAASCIVRAKRQRERNQENGKTKVVPISDQALREAGHFTICRSSAWSSRIITSAWWVESHQVSKTAPTGEYLTVGSFMIRGKKNFLPPSQLEMGLGILFRLGDDDSIARHKNDRRDFAMMEEEEEEEEKVTEEPNTRGSRSPPRNATAAAKAVEPATEKLVEPTISKEALNEETCVPENENELKLGSESPSVAVEEESKESPDPEESQAKEVTVHKPTENGEMNKSAETPVENCDDVGPAPESKADSQVPETKQNEVIDAKPKKKGFSVKERKMIKKYGSLEAAEKAAAEREKEMSEKAKAKTVAKAQPLPSQNVRARGKKGKTKKAARKYADQDDEDRELALVALHGGEKKGRKRGNKKNSQFVSENQEKAAAETAALLVGDAAQVAEQLSLEVRQTLGGCVTVKAQQTEDDVIRWDKFDADILEQLATMTAKEQEAAAKRLAFLKQTQRIDNFSASLSGIIRTIRKYGYENLVTEANVDDATGTKRKTKEEKEKEKEAWKESLAEEGIVDGDDAQEGIDDVVEINKLSGKPLGEDSLLYAVPVCAPYSTLSQYKYRVKLTPGNQKKGKASKQCLELFLKGDKGKSAPSDRDKELIKHVTDNEWVQVMCSDVKISAAGAGKVIKQQKNKGKSNKGKKKK